MKSFTWVGDPINSFFFLICMKQHRKDAGEGINGNHRTVEWLKLVNQSQGWDTNLLIN